MLKTLVIPERARNIAIAVGVAIFAAIFVAFYVSNYKRHVQNEQKNVPVLVASRTIPAGTPGAQVLAKKLATVRELPRRSVVPGSFSKPQQLETLVASEAIYAGEQVTARRFAPREERGVRSDLDGNLRALQVSGDHHQLLAGTLKSGDRVDVVANFKWKAGNRELTFTRVVLRDILVLNAPKTEDGGGVGSSGDEVSVQVAVTDSQAQKLFFAMKNGEWTFDLRAANNAADSPESVETLWTTLRDGIRPSELRRLYGGR